MFVLSDFKYKGMSEVRVSESRLALVLTLTHTKPRPPPSLKPSQPLWAADRRAHEYLCKTFLGGTSLGVEKIRFGSVSLKCFERISSFVQIYQTKNHCNYVSPSSFLLYLFFSRGSLFAQTKPKNHHHDRHNSHEKKIAQAQDSSTEPEPSRGIKKLAPSLATPTASDETHRSRWTKLETIRKGFDVGE